MRCANCKTEYAQEKGAGKKWECPLCGDSVPHADGVCDTAPPPPTTGRLHKYGERERDEARDYGEPWCIEHTAIGDRVRDATGRPAAWPANYEGALDRIIACVNACAGMKDPAAEIALYQTRATPPAEECETIGCTWPAHTADSWCGEHLRASLKQTAAERDAALADRREAEKQLSQTADNLRLAVDRLNAARAEVEKAERDCDRINETWQKEYDALRAENEKLNETHRGVIAGYLERITELKAANGKLRGERDEAAAIIQVVVDSEYGTVWRWPETARATALRNAREFLTALREVKP